MAYSSAVLARLVLVRLHQGYAAILLSSIHEIRQYLGFGLVGQGVANCGDHLGPVVSALLTAIWAGILGRLWVQRGDPARLGLFLIGLGLTINMGRGISFLAFFPLVFAYLGVRCREAFLGRAAVLGG